MVPIPHGGRGINAEKLCLEDAGRMLGSNLVENQMMINNEL